MSEQTPNPMGDPAPSAPHASNPYEQPPQGQQLAYPQQPYGQPGYTQPGYTQPGYAQPGYPQPYGNYAYPPARPNNSLALVSLLCGIGGVTILPFVASIVAVITGHMARKQIRETGEGGDGMAVAGLILGWIMIAGAAAFVLFFLAMGVGIFGIAAGASST